MRMINVFSGALLTLAIQVTASISAGSEPRGIVEAGPILARADSCPAGQYLKGSNCVPCEAGNACAGGDKKPEKCQKGTYAPAGASQCTNCPSGTYSDQDGAATCTTVQCGWKVKAAGGNRGSDGQEKCGTGFYSSAGAMQCTICPKGSYCNSETTCTPQQCQPGWFAPSEGLSSCSACPAGTYVNKYGSTSCCQCCAGSYNSATGQTHCQACPEMTGPGGVKRLVTSDVGSTSSNQCRAYSPGDPAPIPSACVNDSATQNQPTCPATTGPTPSGALRKRNVPRGCSDRKLTMCEVKTGRGGWECIDTKTSLDACGSCDNDCSTIAYVDGVQCVLGQCKVSSCRKGFAVQYIDGKPSCIPTTKQAFLIFKRDMELEK